MVSVLLQEQPITSLFDHISGHSVMPKAKARTFIVVTSNIVKDSKAVILLSEDLTDDMTVLACFHRLSVAKAYKELINHYLGVCSNYNISINVLVLC